MSVSNIPSHIHEMDQINFTDATPVDFEDAVVRLVGTAVTIATIAWAGDVITVTTDDNHGMIDDEYITISGTDVADYHNTYQVTRTGHKTLTAAEETDGGAASGGSFVDEYIDSPIGAPVFKFFAPSGSAGIAERVDLDAAQNMYPNFGFILRVSDGGLDNPDYIHIKDTKSHGSPNYRSDLSLQWAGLIPNQWQYYGPAMKNTNQVTAVSTPADWATTEDNQAFVTTGFGFTYSAAARTLDTVIYLGGVVTENREKGKVILTFDDFSTTVLTEAFPRMAALGYKGAVCPVPYNFTTQARRAEIKTFYNAGWDVINHSFSHIPFDETTNSGQLIDDIYKWKEWAEIYGGRRGRNFIAYPYQEVRLVSNDAGDVLDDIVSMGRGGAFREKYGDRNFSGVSDHINPNIPSDLLNIASISSSVNTDTYTSSLTETAINNAALAKGTSVIILHGIGSGGAESTIVWFEAMLAHIQTKVAAGTIEVVRMSDWYEDIYGYREESDIPANIGFFVQGG